MRTCIIVDCDDVLYRCNLESVSKLNQEIGSSYSIEDITHWGMMKNPLDQRIKYFSDPDFVSNIPLYPGAKEFISSLCEYADVILASCINKECMEVREKSLKMNFPQIKDIYLGDKKKISMAIFYWMMVSITYQRAHVNIWLYLISHGIVTIAISKGCIITRNSYRL